MPRRLVLSGLILFVLVGSVWTASAVAATTGAGTATEGTSTVEFTVDDELDTNLTHAKVERLVRLNPKAHDWLTRYSLPQVVWQSTYNLRDHRWQVKAWYGSAGQIIDAKVDDGTSEVTDVFTGPQVAWSMARGTPGAFGGKQTNRALVWLFFCAMFMVGLGNWRKPLSWRNLDLLVLLTFSASLWFFNEGDIFTSVPLAYPPLVYLTARMAWIGWKGRTSPEGRPLIPLVVLAAAAVFLVGFRIGLNLDGSNVIDVGYASVIGADRIVNGDAPYGHFPSTENPETHAQLLGCGPTDGNGNSRYRIQTNGRCESPNAQGDTYGPVAYLAYIPSVLGYGWSGYWDDLPAAHASAIAFDLLCVLALGLIGLRFGGRRLGVTLAFAWLAYPFTMYASNSNTNDALVPLFLLWGFWLLTHPVAKGVGTALSTWTKFTTVLVVPLWASYPNGLFRLVEAPNALKRLRIRRWPAATASTIWFVTSFLLATWVVFLVLLLEPSLWDALRTFWDRTIHWQLLRRSPFSLWDWGQYHAQGIPDLKILQRALQAALIIAAVVLAFWPKQRSPLRLAAFTAALILGLEIVLTHWFYLYIPWFFPFVAIAVLGAAPLLAKEVESDDQPVERPVEEPVAV